MGYYQIKTMKQLMLHKMCPLCLPCLPLVMMKQTYSDYKGQKTFNKTETEKKINVEDCRQM